MSDQKEDPNDPANASCASTGGGAISFGVDLATAAANMWGLGDVAKNILGTFGIKTTYDKIKDDIQGIYNEIDEFRAQSNVDLFKLQQSEIEDLLTLQQASNQDLTASMNLSSELLNEKISMNEIYIIFCYIFCIVLYIYLLLKKSLVFK